MKCLVTGGSGFIGSNVALELAKDENTEVVIFDKVVPDSDFPWPKNCSYIDGDIRYFEEVLAATQGCDEVYDIAGELGTSELNRTVSRASDTNIRGAANVLEACRVNNVARIFHPTKPNDWLNTYTITKFASEQLCLQYQSQYDMSICCLKWFNAYGPRQHAYPVRKLLPTLALQAANGRKLGVFGDGEQTVDLIHVRDIARIAVWATRNCGKMGKVIDVGSGTAMTVNAVAEKVIEYAGAGEIEHLPMRLGEPDRSDIRADVIDLKQLWDGLDSMTDPLGEDGLKETVEYYKNVPSCVAETASRS